VDDSGRITDFLPVIIRRMRGEVSDDQLRARLERLAVLLQALDKQ
jgi:hypothetical protein